MNPRCAPPNAKRCSRTPTASVYLEAARRWADDELAALGLTLYRHLKAGVVHAHLLQRPVDAAA